MAQGKRALSKRGRERKEGKKERKGTLPDSLNRTKDQGEHVIMMRHDEPLNKHVMSKSPRKTPLIFE